MVEGIIVIVVVDKIIVTIITIDVAGDRNERVGAMPTTVAVVAMINSITKEEVDSWVFWDQHPPSLQWVVQTITIIYTLLESINDPAGRMHLLFQISTKEMHTRRGVIPFI